jgi:hypothetical protein
LKGVYIDDLENFDGSSNACFDEWKSVMVHIGSNVKEFYVGFSCFSFELLQLLMLIPSMEILRVYDNHTDILQFPIGFRLNLPNLRILDVTTCGLKVLSIFDQLNDDILEELFLHNIYEFSTRKYFENQRNIKRLRTNRTDLLNFKQLKLEQVEMNSLDVPTLECLRGQDKVTIAKFRHFDHRSKLDMSGLKSLEILVVETSTDSNFDGEIDLSSNRNMKRVVFYKGFMPIKSDFLQELELINHKISKETLAQLGVKCPNLRYLDVSDVDFDSVFLHFPKLEIIRCSSTSKFSGTFDHDHLKHLCLQFGAQNITDTIAVVKHCTNLQSLSLRFHQKYSKQDAKRFYYASKSKRLHMLKLPQANLSSMDTEWIKNQLKEEFDDVKVENGFVFAKKKCSGSQPLFCCGYQYDLEFLAQQEYIWIWTYKFKSFLDGLNSI